MNNLLVNPAGHAPAVTPCPDMVSSPPCSYGCCCSRHARHMHMQQLQPAAAVACTRSNTTVLISAKIAVAGRKNTRHTPAYHPSTHSVLSPDSSRMLHQLSCSKQMASNDSKSSTQPAATASQPPKMQLYFCKLLLTTAAACSALPPAHHTQRMCTNAFLQALCQLVNIKLPLAALRRPWLRCCCCCCWGGSRVLT